MASQGAATLQGCSHLSAGQEACSTRGPLEATSPLIPHLILCELLAAGLSYGEALCLPLEELLCLLECSRYRQALAALDRESARVASLISADADAQQRELLLLSQKARLLSAKFFA